jgi:hypothetical protein
MQRELSVDSDHGIRADGHKPSSVKGSFLTSHPATLTVAAA